MSGSRKVQSPGKAGQGAGSGQRLRAQEHHCLGVMGIYTLQIVSKGRGMGD
jgi:hypothetical protein